MPLVRVVMLPSLLLPEDLVDRAVCVFDVLRATTSMATALHNGANGIDVFDSLDAVRAARKLQPSGVTVGERNAIRPADFDFGNSPGAFARAAVANRRLLMATTNGTRALVAAQTAANLFAGALVNASATAAALASTQRPITLLCSGTQGNISTEDLLGCGAVIERLPGTVLENDSAQIAAEIWRAAKPRLLSVLQQTLGGHHIRDAGLAPDIEFAANIDSIDVVCHVERSGDSRDPQLRVSASESGSFPDRQ